MIVYLFKIDKCGFYTRGANTPEFGAITDWWDDFVKWVNTAHRVTATQFNIGGNPPSLYCLHAKNTTNGYSLCLWNQIPTTEKGVLSIPGNSALNNIDIHESPIDADDIPGFPTYFWILPNKNAIITMNPGILKFKGTGLNELREYLKHYLKYRSKYAVNQTITNTQGNIVAWRKSPKNTFNYKNIKLYFTTSPFLLTGQLDRIRNDYANIYKIIKKTETVINIERDETIIGALLDLVGINPRQNRAQDVVKYRVEVDWEPSLDELNQVIANWADNQEKEDVGVKIHNATNEGILWFDRASSRKEIEIPPNLASVLLWNGDQLSQVWKKAEKNVLRILGGHQE